MSDAPTKKFNSKTEDGKNKEKRLLFCKVYGYPLKLAVEDDFLVKFVDNLSEPLFPRK